MLNKKLTLKKASLTELTAGELSGVFAAEGSDQCSCGVASCNNITEALARLIQQTS